MKLFDPYIPRTDGNLAIWATTYIEKIGQLGPGLGMSTTQIIGLQEAIRSLVNSIKQVDIKKAEFQAAAEHKRQLQKTVLKQVRNLSRYLKMKPSYTAKIGNELGIVSPGQPVDLGSVKPLLKAKSFQNYVSVSFNKKRMFSVKVYGRLKGNQEWELLDKTRLSPFIDLRPLSEPGRPETREYRIQCYDGLEDIGQFSDIASVVHGG